MARAFASTGDLAQKKISFTEIGRDLWAFSAEGDPKFGDYAIYERCLPFNASRAYDEAR